MKKYIQLAVGIAISAFFIWWAFKSGGIQVADVWQAMRATNWLFAVPFVIVTMASFYWRCIRWRIFLAPTKDIPTNRLFDSLMIGFGFNNIFPARAGEFARPFALMKQEKIPYTAALSTVIVERIVDMLALLALLILMPYYIKFDPNITLEYALSETRTLSINAAWLEAQMPKLSILAAIGMTGIISFLIPPVKKLYIRIVEMLFFVPATLRHKIVELILTFTKGFDSLKDVKAVLMITVHTLVIWLSIAFSFQVMSWGFPGVTIGFGEAVGFLVVTCLVISIPSSPGYWGVYEFGGMLALVLMSVSTNDASGKGAAYAFTIVVHLLQWVPLTAWGLWAAAKLSISAAEAQAIADATEDEILHEGHPPNDEQIRRAGEQTR